MRITKPSAVAAAIVTVTAAAGFVSGLRSGPAAAATADRVVTGPGPGAGHHVRVFAGDGSLTAEKFVAEAPTSGASVATGDWDGDSEGRQEIITGQGRGAGSLVRVFDRATGGLLTQREAFPGFSGGVLVAAAELDGVPGVEIVVAAGPGGGAHVKVFSRDANNGTLRELGGFFAYPPGFSGGASVAAAPGFIITGAGQGGGPHVKVFSVSQSGGAISESAGFFAYDPAFGGGVRVAVANLDADADVELLTAAGPGGGPHVRGFDLTGQPTATSFLAYDAAMTAGVYVGTSRQPGNQDIIIAAAGGGAGPHVQFFSRTGAPATGFFAYDTGMNAGVLVAGFDQRDGGGGTTSTTGASSTTGSTTTTTSGPTSTTAASTTTLPTVPLPTSTTTTTTTTAP